MESLPYISNPASAGLQLAAGSFNNLSFFLDSGYPLDVVGVPE